MTFAAIELREARESDVDAVARIESVSFTDPWSRSAFASLLGHHHVLFLLAERRLPPAFHDAVGARSELAGYVVAWLAADEAEIANLAVAPSLRGQGIGAKLLDGALAQVAGRGAAAVYLEVRESNGAAQRLYASRGFREVGRRRKYYRRPSEDALVLRRDLQVAVTQDASVLDGRSVRSG